MDRIIVLLQSSIADPEVSILSVCSGRKSQSVCWRAGSCKHVARSVPYGVWSVVPTTPMLDARFSIPNAAKPPVPGFDQSFTFSTRTLGATVQGQGQGRGRGRGKREKGKGKGERVSHAMRRKTKPKSSSDISHQPSAIGAAWAVRSELELGAPVAPL